MKETIETLLNAGRAREAREKIRQLREEAEQTGESIDIAWSFRKEAQCDFLEDRLEEARGRLFRALEYARHARDGREQAEAQNSLGIIFGQQGALTDAVAHFKKSYRLHDSYGTGRGASVLNNIGRIYVLMEEHERALEYFQNARSALAQQPDEPHLEGVILGNIGETLSSLARHDEAISVLHESISVFQRHELKVLYAHALARLADARIARNDNTGSDDTAQAEALYRQALETNTAQTEQSWNDELKGKLGTLLVSEGRYEEAESFLEAAIEGATGEPGKTEPIAEWRSRYSEVLEHRGDLPGALQQQRLAYRALADNYRRKLNNKLHEALAVVELRRLENENMDLSHKAQHDPLTSLLNRRAFSARLQEELSRSRRYARPLSLVMLDLDHFKSVNDSIGHIGADQVLIGTAQLLASQSRASDTVARYGGEEIAMILPETGAEQAYKHCEKLRGRIETMNWASLGVNTAITASLGIATLESGDTTKTLLERADAMLYRAKAAGRNTVVADDTL